MSRHVIRSHALRVLVPAPLIAVGVQVTALGAQTPTAADSTAAAAASQAHLPGDTTGPASCCMAPAAVSLPAGLGDSGTYVYELVASESDDIRRAIEHSVAHMNFIIRPIARRRLTRANRLFPLLTVAVQTDTIAVTFAGMNPIVTPRDGEAVPWIRGETGEHYDVRMTQAGDTLRQVIHTDDGQRENDFVFLDSGARVELHVTLTADRLPTPLRYMLIFRRAS